MIKQFKEKIEKNNGFTGQDILIAIFIILIFLSLFTTITINLSNISSEISRVKRMTEVLTKVADRVDTIDYKDIESSTTEKDITQLEACKDIKLDKDMSIKYTIEESGENIKKIKIKATYKNVQPIDITIGKQMISDSEGGGGSSGGSGSGGTTSQIIKINEDAQYPFNRPDPVKENIPQDTYEVGDGSKLVPIRFVWNNVDKRVKSGKWVQTTYDDLEWYSLEENIWPSLSYQTAQTTTPIQGYSNGKYYQFPLRFNPFNSKKGNKDDKYMFIWLPRVLRDKTTSENVDNDYKYGYESTNNTLFYSETQGYIEQKVNNYKEYKADLYNEYTRGTIIGWNMEYGVNGSWDDSLYSDVPRTLREKILNLKTHK